MTKFLSRDAMQSAVYAVVACLSVCVCVYVCHTPNPFVYRLIVASPSRRLQTVPERCVVTSRDTL